MNRFRKKIASQLTAAVIVIAMLLTFIPEPAAAESAAYTGYQGGDCQITLQNSDSVKTTDITTDSSIDQYYSNVINTEIDADSDLSLTFMPTGSGTSNATEEILRDSTLNYVNIYAAADALTQQSPVASYSNGAGAISLTSVSTYGSYLVPTITVAAGTLEPNTEYALVFSKNLYVKNAGRLLGTDVVFYFKTKQKESLISLNTNSLAMSIGDTSQLTAYAAGAQIQAQWSSSDNNVAVVSDGKIRGISAGKAVITASYGGDSITCNVTVNSVVYGMQGTGGNQFSVIQPSDITVLSETEEYYLNQINTGFPDNEDIVFIVKMSAGMQQFNEDVFKTEKMKLIKIYDEYGGNIIAQSVPEGTQKTLTYEGYSADTGITLRVQKGDLQEGDYTLVVDGALAGNSPDNILGKNVAFNFKVVDADGSIAVTGVTLDWTDVTLEKGAVLPMKADIIPADATDKSLQWSSSDEKIASVDADGRVKALAPGSAVITVSAGSKTAECNITVIESSIALNDKTLSLSLNEEHSLIAYKDSVRIYPNWSSSDADIVSVDEKGTVKAAAAGTALITAEYNGEKTVCPVSVESVGFYGWQGLNGNTMILKSPDNIYVKQVDDEKYMNGINTVIDGSKEIVFGFTMSAGMNNFNKNDVFVTNNLPNIKVYNSDGDIAAQYNNTAGQAHLDMMEYDNSRVVYLTVEKESLQNGEYYLVFDKSLCGNNTSKTLGKHVIFKFNVMWFVETLELQLPEDGKSLEEAVGLRLEKDQKASDIENLTINTSNGYQLTDADIDYIRSEMGESLQILDIRGTQIRNNKLKDGALQNCTALTDLMLPTSVTALGSNSVAGCSALTRIIIDAAVPPTVDDTVFSGDTNIREIFVPASGEMAYKADAVWNKFKITVKATGLRLNQDNVEVNYGKTIELIPEIVPSNATNKTITWTSSDDSIATVKNGVVSGHREGSVIITAVAEDGGYNASCKVTVTPVPPILTLSADSVEVYTTGSDNTCKLACEVVDPEPADSENWKSADVRWTSSDDSIAAVNEKTGTVTGIKPGEAVITAWMGQYYKHCIVKVKEHTISLDTEQISLDDGDTYTLKATVDGVLVAGSKAEWSSSNDDIVMVSNSGIITGKSAGTAVITAVANGVSAECTVTVNAKTQKIQLKVPSKVTVSKNTYNSLKITWKGVTGATGYKIYRSTKKNGKYTLIATKGSKVKSYIDKGRITGTTYYYKVRAYCIVDNTPVYSAYSAVKSAKPTLAKVKNIKTAKAGTRKIKVTWGKVAGATGYKVYRSTKKNKGYVLVKTVKAGKIRAFTSGKLIKNKTYYYKVRAYRTVKVNGKTKTVFGPYSVVVSRKAK